MAVGGGGCWVRRGGGSNVANWISDEILVHLEPLVEYLHHEWPVCVILRRDSIDGRLIRGDPFVSRSGCRGLDADPTGGSYNTELREATPHL